MFNIQCPHVYYIFATFEPRVKIWHLETFFRFFFGQNLEIPKIQPLNLRPNFFPKVPKMRKEKEDSSVHAQSTEIIRHKSGVLAMPTKARRILCA
jgi:hypothetical protein